MHDIGVVIVAGTNPVRLRRTQGAAATPLTAPGLHRPHNRPSAHSKRQRCLRYRPRSTAAHRRRAGRTAAPDRDFLDIRRGDRRISACCRLPHAGTTFAARYRVPRKIAPHLPIDEIRRCARTLGAPPHCEATAYGIIRSIPFYPASRCAKVRTDLDRNSDDPHSPVWRYCAALRCLHSRNR
jgi:hypothetical protein